MSNTTKSQRHWIVAGTMTATLALATLVAHFLKDIPLSAPGPFGHFMNGMFFFTSLLACTLMCVIGALLDFLQRARTHKSGEFVHTVHKAETANQARNEQ